MSMFVLKKLSFNLRVMSGCDFEFWDTLLFTFGSKIVRLSPADMDLVFSIDVMHSLGSG